MTRGVQRSSNPADGLLEPLQRHCSLARGPRMDRREAAAAHFTIQRIARGGRRAAWTARGERCVCADRVSVPLLASPIDGGH